MYKEHKAFLAGSITGITETIIGYPLDTLKINYQNNTKIQLNNIYKGFTFAIQSNIITNSFVFGFNNHIQNTYNMNHFQSGFMTGIINGFIITPFENKKIQKQNRIKNINYSKCIHLTILRESIGYSVYFGVYNKIQNDFYLHPLICGGITGMLSWLSTYQIDVISTRMKSNNNLTFKNAIKMGKLWSGFKFCILRSILIGSLNFYTYDKILKLI